MFKVKREITNDQVAGLLCTAFEGGVGYWAQVGDRTKPSQMPKFDGDWKKYPLYSYPLGEGGMVEVKDTETGLIHILNMDSIAKGLQLMADKHPAHFADFISENDDATTGDVFLQCCLLGDVLYG